MQNLRDYNREGSFIQEPSTSHKRLAWIFETVRIRAEKVSKHSFVLVFGGAEKGNWLWLARGLLLFLM